MRSNTIYVFWVWVSVKCNFVFLQYSTTRLTAFGIFAFPIVPTFQLNNDAGAQDLRMKKWQWLRIDLDLGLAWRKFPHKILFYDQVSLLTLRYMYYVHICSSSCKIHIPIQMHTTKENYTCRFCNAKIPIANAK